MSRALNRLIFISLLGYLFLFTSTVVFAQSQAGVQLQPATIEESANPGDIIETTMKVKNVSNGEQTYYIVLKDISGVRNDGIPVFAEEGSELSGYELSSWVQVSAEAITLIAGAETLVPVRIEVPASATPGSHFGGMFITMEPPRLRSTGASVGYEVGSIISIRIAGDVVENARIREFSTDKLVYSKPLVTFKTRVENPGNVLIKPRGPLEVFSMTGKRVALLTVNENLGGVFPGTTREYDVVWEEEGLAIGRYQGVVGLVYGEKGRETTVSATVSFWVLPAHIILPILGILLFLVLAIYFGVRLHIKRTLESLSTGGTRRLPMRRRQRDSGVTRLAMVALSVLAATALFLIVLLVLFA